MTVSKTKSKAKLQRLPHVEKASLPLGKRIKSIWLGFWGWTMRNSVLFKILAIVGIPLLAYSDYNTLQDLFLSEDRLNPEIFAITVAAGLEGLPTIMSAALAKAIDKTRHKVNDARFSWICFIVGVLGFVILCVMMIRQRILSSSQSDYLVVILPIITSFTAFGLSLLAFRQETINSQTLLVEHLEDRYFKKIKAFLHYKYQLQDALVAFWTEVTDQKTKPVKLKDFRNDVFMRAKTKIVEDCKTAFPSQVERYNSVIEAELNEIINDMAAYSTIPGKILQLDRSGIIDEYSNMQQSEASKWKYSDAKTELDTELISLINNAIRVAQIKAFIYQTEEDSLT